MDDPKKEGDPKPAAEFAELKGVEIAEFPCTDGHGVTWDEENGADLARTFEEFGDRVKPPLVLAHVEKASASLAGQPALGWPTKVWMAGKKLLADVGQVPASLASLINQGAYKRVSGSWWYDGRQAGIPEAKRRPVLRHIALLGAETPRIKTLADVQALFGDGAEVPVAQFAEAQGARVAEFADAVPAAAGETPPETLQEAIQQEAVVSRLEPVLRAIRERLWTIEDGGGGKTEEEIAAAVKALGAEIVAFFQEYDAAAPGETPAEEAASEMTDSARDRVVEFLAAKKARGHWKPAWDRGFKAEAAAVFAAGGEEALASFLVRRDAHYVSEVVPVGEHATGAKPGAQDANGAAAMADSPEAAEAGAEYDSSGIARSLGVTREAFVKARLGR